MMRKQARDKGWTVEQLSSRGKGSHSIWAVHDAEGRELGRVGLTGHAGAMSQTVTRSNERAPESIFGRVDGQVSDYDVDVHREGSYWVGVARDVRGGATESRTLAKLEPEVRDLLSGLLDVDPNDVQLRMHYRLSPAADKALGEYRRARSELDQARHRYETAQREAADELRSSELSLRDAAELLGVSFQRVQQLVNS